MATTSDQVADADAVTVVQKMLSATTGSVLTSLLGTSNPPPVMELSQF